MWLIFFSMSHLLRLECPRWHLHSHVWCLRWAALAGKAGASFLSLFELSLSLSLKLTHIAKDSLSPGNLKVRIIAE